jgi:hypothetical protein
MIMFALLDIDGCCIDSSFRTEHINKDFQKYLDLHHTDFSIPQGVIVYSLLMDLNDLKCVFITSRGEEQRATTEKLLGSIFPGKSYELWMRATGDLRDDVIVKQELLEKHDIKAEQVFIAFDDRPVIINMYRSRGIVAYQTAVGY